MMTIAQVSHQAICYVRTHVGIIWIRRQGLSIGR